MNNRNAAIVNYPGGRKGVRRGRRLSVTDRSLPSRLSKIIDRGNHEEYAV